MNETTARILIADDEPLYRTTTAELLQDEGYQCICVENAHDAIDVLKEHSFELILSDLNMPGNLKLELLQVGRIRYSHVPMIVITGVPDVTEVSRDVARDHADRDYLTQLLEKHDGIIASAARQAGLSRQGMNKLLKRHSINANEYRK